jgi:hypothetical protein
MPRSRLRDAHALSRLLMLLAAATLIVIKTAGLPQEISRAVLQLTIQGYEPGITATPFKVEVHRILKPWKEGNGIEGRASPPIPESTNRGFVPQFFPR